MTANKARPISPAGFKRGAGDLSDAIHETGWPLAVVHSGVVVATVRSANGDAPPVALGQDRAEYDRQSQPPPKKPKRGGIAGTVTFNISDEELIYYNSFDPKNYR